MKRIYFTLLGLLFFTGNLFAQYARFPTVGVIEFEKKINMHALIKKSINKDNESYMNQAFEQYKKNQPQFKTLKSTLSFTKDKSLFIPIESQESPSFYSGHPAVTQINTVYNDLSANASIIQKKVFEETFLVRDTTRSINWKITNEMRDIAGFSCRRANAVIMDSIYVVAFYTDEIPVSSGPETFSGLPGMILGVALPHENITWFATSVTDKPLAKPLVSPAKGKLTDNKGLRKILESSLKQYGEYLSMALKIYLL
ncbi:GLPGLI family protein [Pedobacter sp. P351]|uniref:GLPGLI family protein n=1 Tax=Pedobacter superstes TaxID=3133441 RepID=UPI0030B30126